MTLEPVYLVTMPDHENMESGKLYISNKFQLAIHLCACGCKTETVMPFNRQEGWAMEDNNGVITFSPSILNPCKAHYFIRNNEIVWT